MSDCKNQFRQEDPERFEGIKTPESTPGSTWTLIGGMAVFVAIVSTVYAYVFPRLSGEPVSATTSLEIRAACQDIIEHSAEMTVPDGRKWYVAEKVLLAAGDFSTFISVPGANGVPQLTLHLSSAGREHLKKLRCVRGLNDLGVVIHGKLIVCIDLQDLSDEGVTVALNGLSSSDANEVFARLTE